MENSKKLIKKWGKVTVIGIFLILVFFAGNTSGFSKNKMPEVKVLGASVYLTPTPTPFPLPTTAPITIINNIVLPTVTPTFPVSPTPTPLISPTPTTTPMPTPMVIPTSTVTPSPIPSLTPTPQSIGITIDYAGAHKISTYSATIISNEVAWQAVQDAVGIANVQYTDYGGNLGIFITGFNGVDASSNQYFDFQVNGASSNVGVSSYIVQNNDMLKFVLTSF